MTNSTAFLGCDHSYDSLTENLKFGGQIAYLAPAAVLIGRMFYVMAVSYYDDYTEHAFWPFYTIDCALFGTTAWQLNYMEISMAITLTTQFITVLHYLLTSQPKSQLCLVWHAISVVYLLSGAVFSYLQGHSFDLKYSVLVYVLLFFTWDTINVLNPVIMIIGNEHLRKQVFLYGLEEDHGSIFHR
uniref:Serpentine receptor class gamma n=1 Tax=Caenorhabditis japonica TaxID=281687 RepID=A0A8R1E0C6_CAEJA